MHTLRKIIVLLTLSLAIVVPADAQSGMTDKQVMDFIVSENKKGVSREDIVIKLMERGVDMRQIQRVKNKVDKEKDKSVVGAKNISSTPSRQRTNNGEELTPEERAREKRKPFKTRNERLSRDEVREGMYDNIKGFTTDSLELLDQFYADEEGKDKKGRQVFGRSIFNRKNLTFEPEMNIAMPADYRLGPGDAVFVDVYGASQQSYDATVTPDGYIQLEGYGPVQVSGLTVEQANARLRSTLGQRYGGSKVRLSVGQTRTIKVNVMGEVEDPGTFTLSAFSTVFHALYMAGGTNDIGSLRDIKVYRKGRLVSTVDVYDYILNGNLKGNVRLASDDVIYVGPYNCMVNVSGKVKRPMFYEMLPNESVGTLIKYAGGFAGDAYETDVRLIRKKGGEISVYNLDEFERGRFQLADGDSLYVDSTLTRYRNMVEIKGGVLRGGMYQMDGNVTTVRQLIERAGGLAEDAFTARGLIHRRRADRSYEAISFDTRALLDHSAPDIALKNEDIIFIPTLNESQTEKIMTIEGEVVYPGEYEYVENTTVEDFIIQAGGLKDAASTVKVDVSRRLRNTQATEATSEVAQWFSFKLKDGLMVDGIPGFRLQPFDVVYVRRSPGYVEQENVYLEGEAVFPGSYSMTHKTYRLSDLVKAAGGLTREAYAHGARIERVLTYAEQMKQQDLLKLIISDSVDVRKINTGNTRSIGINLQEALAHPGGEYDVVLREGDRIIIPQYSNTVTINGEVFYPNTVSYRKGAKLDYYINQSGGYTTKAKKSKVFAINMNGTVTRVRKAADIQPGCEIVVPAKPKRNGMSLAEVVSLGTMGASLAAVLVSLLK